MRNKNLSSSLKWIFEVSRRFARIDRKGRTSATSFMSTLGICFGVMTLITVVSVMNGFQSYSINPIMEISSAHLRVTEIPDENFTDFLDFCAENPKIACVSPFYESQGLIVGRKNKQSAAVIRAVEPNIREIIAFPKNTQARCVMSGAPSPTMPGQLEELHLKVDLPEKKDVCHHQGLHAGERCHYSQAPRHSHHHIPSE